MQHLQTDGRFDDPQGYISEGKLAHRWQMSRRTLQRWRQYETGPTFYEIGGSIRYRVADVLAFEEARRKGATS
ncbi:helix-turn-helix domain-containing protein [Rhodobacteraceae bacterium D3-12]|nr:helix-turn-helix domain-containing protein [Rhodobacteraceae bacterium D3-12]